MNRSSCAALPMMWLKDPRNREVGQHLLRAMMDRPTATLSHLAQNRAQEVAFSRWLANPRIHLDQLIHSVRTQTQQRVRDQAHAHVLVISDTTEINLNATDGYRQDDALGVTGNARDSGFFMHAGLALSAEHGQLLGCASLQVWTRHGAHDLGRIESDKWCEVARQVSPLAPTVTLVHDREGDVFDHWVQVQGRGLHLLTRARHDRRIWQAASAQFGKLYTTMQHAPLLGSFALQIAPSSPGTPFRARRRSRMEVRMCRVELVRHRDTGRRPCTTSVTALEVRERDADVPCQERAVVWRLLTTHAVNTLEDALQIVQWYRWRWQAEDCFATLKSRALHLEQSRLHHGAALLKLGVMSVWSAVHLQTLVKGREDTVTSALTVFTEPQLHCLKAITPQLEGKTLAQSNPHPPRSLAWAVWIIARLGHHHDRRPPGPTRLKRGLERFDALFLGWTAARESLP